ncbi:hypothetical protein TRIP_C20926 [Candidatus Zixiibacteriota bacterium]|nr:hypothetical protein TRIP_C20926 [candidate division Zixibacteria bacterium]
MQIISAILVFLAMNLQGEGQSKSEVNFHLEKGRVLASEGKLNAAENQYLMAIKKDSLCAVAYSNLGTCYYRQNALKPAERMFCKALALDSTLVEAKQNLGIVYYSLDKVSDAVNLWRSILAHDSSYGDLARIHLFIGIAYLYSPEIVGADSFVVMALEQFNLALVIDPGSGEAHFWKAKARELIPDLPGAIAEYKMATELNPKYGEAYNQWGVLLYRDEAYAAAWDKFTEAVYCDPGNAIFHYNLGLTYLARNMRFEGEEEVQKAYKLNPHLEASSQPIIIDPAAVAFGKR